MKKLIKALILTGIMLWGPIGCTGFRPIHAGSPQAQMKFKDVDERNFKKY